jgi:hydrogenase nickel incorporation protein HypA/HybF
MERVVDEARQRGASRVHRVHVSIGELSGVEIELLVTAFETFRERTPLAETELSVRPVAARWECPRCHQPRARGAILACPACGVPARLAAGDEIMLDRIELEVRDV